MLYAFFFFNDTATTEIYTLSLHDALPICRGGRAAALHHLRGARAGRDRRPGRVRAFAFTRATAPAASLGRRRFPQRSEEHTSELQSRQYLVCRLLLEKKKLIDTKNTRTHS